MKQKTYSSEGIILKRINYGEADRILTVFTRDFGKLSLLAKGVRKIKSKKRGHLEVFSQIKFSAHKTPVLDVLTEVLAIKNFEIIREDLKKVSLAYYFCEVINKITHDGEHPSTIYNLLSTVLEQLEHETKLKKIRLEFIYNLLTEMGYWPRGKKMADPDNELSNILERQLTSVRVGKKVLE